MIETALARVTIRVRMSIRGEGDKAESMIDTTLARVTVRVRIYDQADWRPTSLSSVEAWI
jgi:hypothetical protein